MKPILNQNNSLVTILDLKNGGYRLYNTFNLNKVSENDDYQELLGPLRFFIPLYESKICFFVGTAYNLNFPPDQIIVWDEERKRKAGIILLKGACDYLKVRKEMLVCMVEFQILVFEIYKMELILILDDCNNYFPFEISYDGNPAVIVYQSKSQPKQVKVVKIKLEPMSNKLISDKVNEYKEKFNLSIQDWGEILIPTHKKQFVVSTIFQDIVRIKVSNNGEFLIIIGSKNRLHVYETSSFRNIVCLECEYSTLLIQSIFIGSVFFAVGYDTGIVHIYILRNKKIIECECLKNSELMYEKPKSLSIFDKIVKIKDLIFEKPKINPFSTFTFENNDKPYTIYFIKKNELVCISEEKINKYKFSLIEGGKAWCYKEGNFINGKYEGTTFEDY